MTVDQISVFVENKPGKLVEMLEVLGQKNVDLRAMTLADTADFGILRLIAKSPDETKEIISDAGYVASVTQVLAIGVPDTPGGLAKVLRILSDGGVSVEYIYAILTRAETAACIIVRVDDNDAATKLLESNGIKLFCTDDICR